MPSECKLDPGRVPGNPIWHLAPREMAWEGKTSARSAPKSRIQHATATEHWRASWNNRQGPPGRLGLGARYGRKPAPGTQKEAGALVEAWVTSGSVCPGAIEIQRGTVIRAFGMVMSSVSALLSLVLTIASHESAGAETQVQPVAPRTSSRST